MADELQVVRSELHRRGWTFHGWHPTHDGRGEFVAERPHGPFAMAPTATGLLVSVLQLGGNE